MKKKGYSTKEMTKEPVNEQAAPQRDAGNMIDEIPPALPNQSINGGQHDFINPFAPGKGINVGWLAIGEAGIPIEELHRQKDILNNRLRKIAIPENNTGLTKDQIKELRAMNDIRSAYQPQHSRLDDFNKQQARADASGGSITNEQIIVINSQQVHTPDEIAAALIDAYRDTPQLYEFEVNEAHSPANEPLQDIAENLER